ncbi:diaminopimelate decarboxylase [Corynebacterium sp. sy017]|uniref:diaminopimelate decarboxylase n=1 Tax=unclassified Corynebacterium TaxID=2624378 RepID=UPI0011868569|nr:MULTISPECIES: diaminopimelate decarboxylase [unclassified Corynebacterium]MBP3089001.1 diaminopimelate decarboxylase [Corynebacterium sp. sy017]TSD91323.1 diaminopimelate decarboxylase [Corynebacterium sp. SY003]
MGDFNALPAHVWPRNARREADGSVSIAGVSLPELAKEYGTVLMVIDEQDFRSRCQDMARAFGASNVHYASKAFISTTIARWVHEEGLHIDVASQGELEVALHADFPPEDITAHGNNKSDEFLRRCVSLGVGTIVVDSYYELRRLDEIAAECGRTQDVLIRVKPGIEAHTHEFIATSHEDQKFGFSLASGSAYQAAVQAHEAQNLVLCGLHCHIGSQIFDAEGFKLAAERVLQLYQQLSLVIGADVLKVLDLGGGFGIAYQAQEAPFDVAAIARELIDVVAYTAQRLGVKPPRVMVEPGRSIVGPSAVSIYTVGTIKDVSVAEKNKRRYIAVDGGMSDNVRPLLYEAEYDVRAIDGFCSGELVDSRIVGSHCESGDILVRNRKLPDDITPGQYIAFAATGAYCYALSSRYNMFMRPAVLSVKDGQVTVMLRRETVDDFFALEVS